MGYSTTYELKWQPLNAGSTIPQYEIDDLVTSAIRAAKEKDDNFMYAIDENGESIDAYKWYDHQKEVAHFSKKFPDVLFTLHGKGEESGDVWKKYFVNGKVQVAKAKLVFDEFDEKKLA